MNTSGRAACTIVSRNYLPYARTLGRSIQEHCPGLPFYVLLVDEPGELDLTAEPFEVILARDLGIPNFLSVAFKFDILELNTAVKPSFLKYLFAAKNLKQALYFDPDISVYHSLDLLYETLEEDSILLIPHITKKIEDHLNPQEQEFLLGGVFNLGFVGVANSAEGAAFLDWWEARCLKLGYADQKNGLFVDQKWTNLVPCLFDSVAIEKHPGCNVAYWNLHERTISEQAGRYFVNVDWPLLFFHFSGISVDGAEQISKHTDRFTLGTRPDLVSLFAEYRSALEANQIREMRGEKYAYGYFSDGRPVMKIARTVFSFFEDHYVGENPFDSRSRFYKDAQQFGLLAKADSSARYNAKNLNKGDWRLRLINGSLRRVLKTMGADRYTMLMKYLSYIANLRNQKDLFSDFH